MRVNYQDLEKYSEEILLKGGFDAEESAFMAKELVLANLVAKKTANISTDIFSTYANNHRQTFRNICILFN